MKRIIVISIGNIVLLLLLCLALLFPFSSLQQAGETGFAATLTIFPFLFIAYLMLYPIALYFSKKLFRWNTREDSEFSFSDEREKTITMGAATTTYKVLFSGVLVSVATLGTVKFFALFSHIEISIYFVSVLLLTALLIISTASYCIKWCLEYRK